MRNPPTFQDSDTKDTRQLTRKLNDLVTSVVDAQNKASSGLSVELYVVRFATQAYANPYDAPFPISFQASGPVSGVWVAKLEKISVAGKLRGAVGGVYVLWSNIQGGKVLVESMTGLAANTAYECTLAAVL